MNWKKSIGNLDLTNTDVCNIITGTTATRYASLCVENESGVTSIFGNYYDRNEWLTIADSSYGSFYLTGNTSNTTLTTGYQEFNITLFEESSYGITYSGNGFIVEWPGDYFVAAYIGCKQVGTPNNIFLGVSKSATIEPDNFVYNNISVTGDYNQLGCPVYLNTIVKNLVSNDVIRMYVKSETGADILVPNAGFLIKRMKRL